MSYEGYTTYKCKQGHEHSFDVYDYGHSMFCPVCSEAFYEERGTDMTNGIEEGYTIEDYQTDWRKVTYYED